LEIPVDKFEKMFASNSAFFDEINLCAQVKLQKRNEKIEKSMQIYDQFNKSTEKPGKEATTEPLKPNNKTAGKLGARRRTSAPVHITHGYVIKKIPAGKS
jgi:hypothetical protein